MTKGDKIFALVVGGYMAMIGATHGYIASQPPFECDPGWYRADCEFTHGANTLIVPLIWPLYWVSHITQEALK